MKRKVYLFCLLFGIFSTQIVQSQDITGIWRGYFISANGSQYKYEVQIEQSGSNRLTGVTYSYLDTTFYGKAVFTGNFSSASGKALVQEMKTVEVKMSWGSVSCIMTCQLEFIKSGREEFLEGTFKSAHEADAYGAKKGDDCGGGTVYLRRVKTSDFYVEPSLRAKIEQRNNPPLVKNNPPSTGTKPAEKKPAPSNNTKATVTKPVTKTVTPKKQEPTVKKEQEPVKKETTTRAVVPQEKLVERPALPTPLPLKDRTNELFKTISVSVSELTVKLYDNGEIDDDTISVYLNKKLVLSHKKLTAAPLVVTIKLDESDPDQELVMVAENLGRIPPNTSLMVVDAGSQRFEVRITSTEQKNAMVKFRYVKPVDRLPLP